MFGLEARHREEASMTAQQPFTFRVERSPKRVRVYLAGELVADTRGALLVWEHPYYPVYYLPARDIRAKLIPAGPAGTDGGGDAGLGAGELLDVAVDAATAAGAGRRYPAAPRAELRDAVRFDWNAMSEWLEEDEPVYVHARDPHTRIDILASSRHVRVELDGVTVAESRRPRILFETGLPPRHYLPLGDVRMDLFRPSGTQTSCPYKGTASYWSVDTGQNVHTDVVWIYRTPLPESQQVAGLACFYDEKVDVYLDGEHQRQPHTPFS
jgi:uncharacterized protein (DUF427 family)